MAMGLFGVGVGPPPGRELADVDGVLWLDRASAALDRLEFVFRNLPYPRTSWPEVGGEIHFRPVEGIGWIVSEWALRIPLEAEWSRGESRRPEDLALVRISERGARVRGTLPR